MYTPREIFLIQILILRSLQIHIQNILHFYLEEKIIIESMLLLSINAFGISNRYKTRRCRYDIVTKNEERKYR